MTRPRRVLLVSYYYPPMQAIGSYRLASLARHLPAFGFEPVVLSAEVTKCTWHGLLDTASLGPEHVERVPGAHIGAVVRRLFGAGLTAHGAPGAAPRNAGAAKRLAAALYEQVLTFPDPEWPWYVLGRKKALAAARRLAPDVVLSSALPFSCHLMAGEIASCLGIPWVADYRDLWSLNHLRKRHPAIHRIETALERRVLVSAAALTTVSPPLSETLSTFAGKPVTVVTNGFEPDDFAGVPQTPPEGAPRARLTIVYTGFLYLGKRDPLPLFQALRALLETRAIGPGDVLVRFFGANTHILSPMLHEMGLDPFVTLSPIIPREDALRLQKSAGALLFLEWNDPSARGVFTGKFFEYLAAGRPIVALGPPGGVVDAALRETGAGVMENDPQGLARLLLRLLETGSLGEGGGPRAPDPSVLQRYTREYQAGVMAGVLREALSRGTPGDALCGGVL